MTLTNYLKAFAKTAAAGIVGFLAAQGIEVDGAALEIVLTGVFVGAGSIVLNLVLSGLNKLPFVEWVAKLLPSYD